MLKAATALGGFAGLMCFAIIWFLGRRILWLCEAFDRHTKMELLRLIASPHITKELKDTLALQLQDVEDAQIIRKKK